MYFNKFIKCGELKIANNLFHRWKSGSTLFKYLRSVKVPQKDGSPPIGKVIPS